MQQPPPITELHNLYGYGGVAVQSSADLHAAVARSILAFLRGIGQQHKLLYLQTGVRINQVNGKANQLETTPVKHLKWFIWLAVAYQVELSSRDRMRVSRTLQTALQVASWY